MTRKRIDQAAGASAPAAFDPWSCSWEQAREAEASASPAPAVGPIAQWVAVQRVLNARLAVETGDGFAVLEAIAACALHGLVAPDWLASEFLKRYRAVQQLRVDSWDAEEAFGKPYPKGFQLARARVRRAARLRVVLLVENFVRRSPSDPLDAEWDRIGREANVGKTLAQELYSEAVALGRALPVLELKKRSGNGPQPARPRKVAGRRKHR